MTPRAAGASWASRFDQPLPRSFYARDSVVVARALLGTLLLRRSAEGLRAVRIVETEAYRARDPASHAFRGRTTRNASMFAGPGTLYVFRIHQVHCLNAVTGSGAAVLLRAGEPLTDGLPAPRGPGRLARALGLDRSYDGLDLVRSDVRIVAGERGRSGIDVGPRVGISQAKDRPWRFAVRGSPWVSPPRVVPRGRPG